MKLQRTQVQTQSPKKFHIEMKNNNKTRANVKLFQETGFEFGYAVTALYFRHKTFSYLGNMAAVFMKQFENFINLCAKVAFTATTFGSLATVPSHKKLFDKFSRSNYFQLLWKLWQLHLSMPMEKSRCVEMFFFQEHYCFNATVFQARWTSKCTRLISRYSFSISILSREILGAWN